jgi:hypothetical protein
LRDRLTEIRGVYVCGEGVREILQSVDPNIVEIHFFDYGG